MNRKNIIENAGKLRRVKDRASQSKIIRTYNYLLFQYIKPEIEKFLIIHGLSMTDITIQCETDCLSFTKDNSLHYANIGIAYRISDVVAWCNNHNVMLKGVIEKDFTLDLERKLIERLTR